VIGEESLTVRLSFLISICELAFVVLNYLEEDYLVKKVMTLVGDGVSGVSLSKLRFINKN